MFKRKVVEQQQQQLPSAEGEVEAVANDTKYHKNKATRAFRSRLLAASILSLSIYLYLHDLSTEHDGPARSLLSSISGLRAKRSPPPLPPLKGFTDADGHWTPPPGWALTPLRQIDVEKFTIRMNTWRRPKQLKFSVEHYSTCPNVAQIQVVWCDKDNKPPQEVVDNPKAVVEYQELNSLNERFRILESTDTPTLGILNVDDDAVLPCTALDSGFYRWTKAPERMVGFDGRAHVEAEGGKWKHQYAAKKTVGMTNKYSLSLTRIAFTHRDYLDLYIQQLPDDMLERIAKNFNCEDIAMSFMISSVTEGKAPLLADCWVLPRMIELHTPGISAGGHHQKIRHACINDFAEAFGIKDGPKKLQLAELRPSGARDFLECGAHLEGDASSHLQKSVGHIAYDAMMEEWKQAASPKLQKDEIDRMYMPLEDKADAASMILKTMRASRIKYYGLNKNP